MLQMGNSKIVMLRPAEIQPCGSQPRKHFDEYELASLAESIRRNGIIQPLIVRRSRAGGYELIAGERRLRAAIMVGLRRIPCVLCNADSCQSALYAITENLQRCDLSMFEEAIAIKKLISDFGLDRTSVAEQLGIAQSTLSNKLRLLNLCTEHRERIVKAGLTERHARALLRLDEADRGEALNHILAQGLTLKQTEDYIENLLSPKEIKEKPQEKIPIRKMAIGDIRLFANSLNKLVSTMVDSGINACSKRKESEKYIEYTIKINKASLKEDNACQLRIC